MPGLIALARQRVRTYADVAPQALAMSILLLAGAHFAPPAHASFPGANGLLAVSRVTEVGSGCCGGGSESEENSVVQLVAPRSGKVVRRVSDCREPDCTDGSPAWSPDGKWLVLTRNGVISVVRPDGSGLRALAPGGSAAWSPDGRALVFVGEVKRARSCCTKIELFIVRRDGSGLRRLTFRGGSEPAWGPDGRIAFERGHPRRNQIDIYTVRPNGRGLRRLGRGVAAEWSPGGTKIAFQSDPFAPARARGVFVMTAAGLVLGRVAHGDAKNPVWSPDGRLITFQRRFDTTYVTRSSLGGDRRTERLICRECITFDWQPLKANYATPERPPQETVPEENVAGE